MLTGFVKTIFNICALIIIGKLLIGYGYNSGVQAGFQAGIKFEKERQLNNIKFED